MVRWGGVRPGITPSSFLMGMIQMRFEEFRLVGSMLANLAARVVKQSIQKFVSLAKIEMFGWEEAISEQVPHHAVLLPVPFLDTYTGSIASMVVRAPARPVKGPSIVLARIKAMVAATANLTRDWSIPVRRHSKRGGVWAMEGFESMARAGRDKWRSVEEIVGHRIERTGIGRHRAVTA